MEQVIDKQQNKDGSQVVVTANASCKKCQGRGTIGTDIKTGRKIVCKCVQVISPKKDK